MDSVSSLRRYLNLKNTLNQNLLEDYTKAINERPRRIHGYQSAVKTTRENGWLALRLKASATGRGLKAYRMVSLQHHLC